MVLRDIIVLSKNKSGDYILSVLVSVSYYKAKRNGFFCYCVFLSVYLRVSYFRGGEGYNIVLSMNEAP